MNDTKSIVSSLRSLSTSIAHTDIAKSTLFQDAAAEIERLDKALYDEKEKTRRLTRELSPLKQYDRERREIVTLRSGFKISGYELCDWVDDLREKAEKDKIVMDIARKIVQADLIEFQSSADEDDTILTGTLRVIHPRSKLIPADPGWFSRNHIDPDSPLMTE